ncbi:MAG: rod shape-determining protein MreC [Candidatus Uhrbacteria bacterium]
MKNKQRYIFYIITTIIGLFVVLFFSGYLVVALGIIQRPFVSSGTWFSGFSTSLRGHSALISENETLQNKIEALSVYEAELETLRAENENLKLQLGYISDQAWQSVTAAVTTRSVGPSESLITIDQGEEQGILAGQPVIAAEGILIGKIISVGQRTSVVQLLNDRSSKTASTILNSSRTLGLVEGTGGTLLDFRYIPQNVELSENDLVVTSGLENGVPGGLVIGLINNIETDPNEPFQTAVVEPVIDYRVYTMVTVITIN